MRVRVRMRVVLCPSAPNNRFFFPWPVKSLPLKGVLLRFHFSIDRQSKPAACFSRKTKDRSRAAATACVKSGFAQKTGGARVGFASKTGDDKFVTRPKIPELCAGFASKTGHRIASEGM